VTTIVGTVLAICTAYLAASYNNIMDLLQLVFSFVNAPLFATFLLGMFWKRTTGHGAFTGLLSGTAAAAATHGLTMAEGKGGWIATLHQFPSTMAQNFWIAIFAWSACFIVTLIVSLVTAPRVPEELSGLVYGLTKMPSSAEEPWYRRPGVLAMVVLAAVAVLNVIFW
jgi:SSS family solute:Na+ symporter